MHLVKHLSTSIMNFNNTISGGGGGGGGAKRVPRGVGKFAALIKLVYFKQISHLVHLLTVMFLSAVWFVDFFCVAVTNLERGYN